MRFEKLSSHHASYDTSLVIVFLHAANYKNVFLFKYILFV